MTLRGVSCTAMLALALTSPCHGQQMLRPMPLVVAAAAPPVDPKIVALAKEWFHRFQTGDISRSQLDSAINLELTESSIQREEAELKPYGKPTSFKFVSKEQIGAFIGYDFILTFDAGAVVESIAFDRRGKIAWARFSRVRPRVRRRAVGDS